MAKRHKKNKSKRRRVSGIKASGGIMEPIAISAGFIGGNIAVNKAVAQFAPTLDPKIVAAGQVVIGFILNKKGKGILKSIGTGVAVGGVYALARNVMPGLVSGIGAAPLVRFDNSSLGFTNQAVIHGPGVPYNEMSLIAGVNSAGQYNYNYQ